MQWYSQSTTTREYSRKDNALVSFLGLLVSMGGDDNLFSGRSQARMPLKKTYGKLVNNFKIKEEEILINIKYNSSRNIKRVRKCRAARLVTSALRRAAADGANVRSVRRRDAER
ncbi:hypothetical protein EVAR_76352_1 [Eumeta japonica]|uniref:Uncharacterized protein n=1 Tax=Eumeta variegata TaxID=151549 RepID=A0A4C1T8G9_EUMVA|nr:hypothetical protein EVAR_76352_1 [Eumeta japonica]